MIKKRKKESNGQQYIQYIHKYQIKMHIACGT